MGGAMDSPGGVVVEFVGLPASGKTYVAREVKRRFASLTSAANTADPVSIRTATESRGDGYASVDAVGLVLARILRDPRTCLGSISPIRRSGQPSVGYQLRYLGYLLFVVEEIRRSRSNGEIYLVDQGFFQHLWRIHLTGEGDTMQCLTELADAYLETVDPDIVVFVSVDHTTRMERAIDRGTSVDPALFDPNHPLIADDREAYEDVRTFVPIVADHHNLTTIDIENTADRLEENVDTIVEAIAHEHGGETGLSVSSRENQSGSPAGR